ncbi:GNAT family N-acetyltransferase [Acinetobacter baumannii]|uniref:GNAT family N-acetyltransferase n=2 Tax=Acinetobacter baumannii TaxID=470 RepID=A0A090B611_ACIBA|nr:GNAT family N-acetyltransferase [Acinetobacter baumannii]EKX9478618.1 GNAT family N-acetyltransferase [Acinetobacter baumannii]EXD54535.1 acetyltransferase family protein [Acinetobacter baumannii 781407]EXE32113.1 acetyltransferase family protein [Acinetobacter baumannii 1525283]KAB0453903.1 GNAT family N-acetyltransferase [Acinetobacter baumannii]KMV03729.1 acetyltransferase family protein [Acinetobacter baumannii]
MYKVIAGSWTQFEEDAKYIREQVFIQEQGIEPEDEWDDFDSIAMHFMVYGKEQPIATARLLPQHSVGRVAVLMPYRKQGIGKILMQHIIEYARQHKLPYLKLSAQTYVTAFYEALGFKVQGEVYQDCGIPHIDMTLTLS